MNDDPGDELESLFDLHAFPLLGDTGALRIIGHIRAMREEYDDEPFMLLYETRHAIRCVAAVLPAGENGPVDVATVCGLLHTPVNMFVSCLTSTGDWAGELGVEGVAAFLHATIGAGEHPLKLSVEINMSEEDYEQLNDLLDLEVHWDETRKDRVLALVRAGASLREIRKMAGGWIEAMELRRWAWRQLLTDD